MVVEFALIFLVMVATTVGAIEASLAMFQWTSAEKATQLGARRAAVSDVVAGGLAGFAGSPSQTHPTGTPCLLADQPLESSPCYFEAVRCTADGCAGGDFNAASFAAVVGEMQRAMPQIRPENVVVEYSFAGLGYVGQPGGLPFAVTVRLTGMAFEFIVIHALLDLDNRIPMPSFAATLTGEDLSSAPPKV